MKKTQFTTKAFANLKNEQIFFCDRVKLLLKRESALETLAYLSGDLSIDGKTRPLVLSLEIVDKIQTEHGNILPENLICNAHEWEFATINMDNNPDKINLIKLIPNSENYLLIAANRDNGFYMVTHFETKTTNNRNLKRLLGRGNVLNRVPSVCPHTNQGNLPTREGI